LDEHWQGRTIAVMLRHTQAADIGAPSAGNAGFVVIQTHLSLGLNAKQSSASRRYGCRWPQFRDQPQDIGEQISRDGDLGHLECDVAAVANDLRADLDEFLLQARQRLVLDRLRRRQCS
jgi:hypothetical protein